MKRAIATLAASALIAIVPASFAVAQSACPGFASVDADQSGAATFEEVSAAVPGITQDQFNAADADQSGDLSPDEYATLDCSANAGQ